MTIKTYNNEVELTFDNQELEGYINLEVEGGDVILSLDAHESGMIGEEAITLLEIEGLKLDKQNLITFLDKSLEMLKKEV
tara:strand:- start:901 stop:1140 length:240 start_codon:yes stop_codon:yes gene_type:complete